MQTIRQALPMHRLSVVAVGVLLLTLQSQAAKLSACAKTCISVGTCTKADLCSTSCFGTCLTTACSASLDQQLLIKACSGTFEPAAAGAPAVTDSAGTVAVSGAVTETPERKPHDLGAATTSTVPETSTSQKPPKPVTAPDTPDSPASSSKAHSSDVPAPMDASESSSNSSSTNSTSDMNDEEDDEGSSDAGSTLSVPMIVAGTTALIMSIAGIALL